MKKLGNEEAQGIGQFNCLPEDILMSILNRLHDLKGLFQCTLVSKGFASKIHRIKSISLKLPACDMDSTKASTNIFHLSEEMLRVEIQKKSEVCPPPSPRQELKFIEFLKKFTELECTFFESACPRTPCSSPSLKWKAKLGNCGPAVQMLVSVLPSMICEEAEPEYEVEEADEDEEDEEDDEEDEDDDEEDEEDAEEDEGWNTHEFPLAKGCLLFSLMSFAEWFAIVFSLIEQHHTLKSVICTDSGKHGKIVLNDERIVEWRKRLLCRELSHYAIPITITTGRVPSSDLSLPGCPIKGASFVLMNFLPGLHYEVLKSFEYDEEEKVVADAMNGIFTKHHRNLSSIIRPWDL